MEANDRQTFIHFLVILLVIYFSQELCLQSMSLVHYYQLNNFLVSAAVQLVDVTSTFI